MSRNREVHRGAVLLPRLVHTFLFDRRAFPSSSYTQAAQDHDFSKINAIKINKYD